MTGVKKLDDADRLRALNMHSPSKKYCYELNQKEDPPPPPLPFFSKKKRRRKKKDPKGSHPREKTRQHEPKERQTQPFLNPLSLSLFPSPPFLTRFFLPPLPSSFRLSTKRKRKKKKPKKSKKKRKKKRKKRKKAEE
jgi:hypothetical protein